MRKFSISLVSAFAALCAFAAGASAEHNLREPEKYAIESVSASLSSTQAGAHADVTTSIRLNENEGWPYDTTRDVIVELPPGFAGNPEAFPKCSTLQFGTEIENSECPQDSQVGSTDITIINGTFNNSP